MARNITQSDSGESSGNNQAGVAQLGACPFQETRDWHGSIEGGRLLVNGKVDLLMAGFRPTLTKRAAAAPGTVAFDLSLVQEAGAFDSDGPRYEQSGSPRYGQVEIYCGGQKIENFDTVIVAD